jgi:hypothetical protein
MALVVPDVGEVSLLESMLNHTSAGDVVLKLYTNNYTPDEDAVLGSFTESTGTGYADKTLTGSSWTVSTSAGTTTAEYAQQSFDYTGAEANVYGYYVVNNAETELLWAEIFTDGPYSIPSGGGSIKVTPKIELA